MQRPVIGVIRLSGVALVATQEQVRREGIPHCHADSPEIKVQHAPWRLINADGSLRQNPHFEDQVLFTEGVHAETSFVILDGRVWAGWKCLFLMGLLHGCHCPLLPLGALGRVSHPP